MVRIESEKNTLRFMVLYYCRKHHGGAVPCTDCAGLIAYAEGRLDRCRYGESKASCLLCPTHCYAAGERARIRAIMRYVGPRMIYLKPLEALKHLFRR